MAWRNESSTVVDEAPVALVVAEIPPEESGSLARGRWLDAGWYWWLRAAGPAGQTLTTKPHGPHASESAARESACRILGLVSPEQDERAPDGAAG